MTLIGVCRSAGWSAAVLIWWLGGSAWVHGVQDKYSLAGTMLDKGAYAKAIVAYEDLLQESDGMDERQRSRINNNIGFAYFKLKQSDKALQYYHEALDLDPAYTTCLNNVAVVLIGTGRYGEALDYLERANKVDPTIKIVFNLFVVHYRLNHRDKALGFIEEAFKLDTGYTEARLKANNVRESDIKELKRRISGRIPLRPDS